MFFSSCKQDHVDAMHNLFILCPVQKAGFMLVEVSFAKTPEERRNVVIIVRVGAKQREYV